MDIGKQREAVLFCIKAAGKDGISISDIMKSTGLGRDSVVRCLLAEDPVYEETLKNGKIKYFWFDRSVYDV